MSSDYKLPKNVIDLNSSLIFYGIMLYFLCLIIEAPIRYILFLARVSFLIYLRDLFIILVIITYIIKACTCGKINKIILILLFLLLFHTVVGLLYIGKPFQVAFGLKVLMPLILGMVAYPFFESRANTIKIIFTIFIIIALLGVYLNFFMQFPWEGLSYDVAGKSIEATREWGTFGIRRIAGFSRTSFAAAMQITILNIYLISYLQNKWIKSVLWFVSAPALLLTTQKGLIIVFVIISLFYVIFSIIPNICHYYQKLLIIPLLVMIMLPVYAWFFNMESQSMNFLKNPLLITMRMRMQDWPNDLDFLEKHGNSFLGRGVGALGMSQVYFENQYTMPGDNLFVYGFGYFGIMIIIYLLYIYKLGQNVNLKDSLFYYLLILTLFFYGIVSNVIEDSFFLILLGVSLRYLRIKKDNKIGCALARP